MLACDDSTSMLCARVVRGAASSAKLVSPAARRCRPSAVERVEHADQRRAGFISASSSGGTRTLSTSSAAEGARRSVISAPAA